MKSFLIMIDKFYKLTMATIMVVAVVGVAFTFSRGDSNSFLINTDRTSVIKGIRELQRLETATFTIEKVIDARTDSRGIRDFLFGDRLLLIAHAQVIAGIDVSKLSNSDIKVSENKVELKLPAPEIFLTDLDESKTQIYDRRKGLLTKGQDQLESDARAAAESSIRAAACEGGILDQAGDNARHQMEAFLSALGFEEVTVSIPKGEC